MTRYSDEQIAAIHSTLSSPRFNALRLRVTMHEPQERVSPWENTARGVGEPDAELERDTQRDQGSR